MARGAESATPPWRGMEVRKAPRSHGLPARKRACRPTDGEGGLSAALALRSRPVAVLGASWSVYPSFAASCASFFLRLRSLSLRSTSSRMTISDASPKRLPIFSIRV